MMYATHTSLFSLLFSNGFGSYMCFDGGFFSNLASALISLTFHQYSIAMGTLIQMRYGLVEPFLQMSFISLLSFSLYLYIHYHVQRDCGRPPEPRKDPGSKPEEEGLLSDHPYVDKVYVLVMSCWLYENHQC